MMLCQQVRQRLERDGSRLVREHELLGRHIGECDVCRALVQNLERQQHVLQRALADMPVPDPGENFEARLMASVLPARRNDARQREMSQQFLRWPAKRTGVHALGMVFGLAASFALAVILAPQLIGIFAQTPETLAHENTLRPVHVRLDSPQALEGATIRIQLPAHTSLRGFRDVKSLQWQTDIPAGANRITLPLQVQSGLADGLQAGASLTVEVEYRGAKKTLRYAIPDIKPVASSPQQSLIKI